MQPDWTVAPARWWHMPGLTRMFRRFGRRRYPIVDLPNTSEALVWAPFWSPSVGLLQSVWSGAVIGGFRTRSFVVDQGGRPIGLGQCRPRPESPHWEVVFLAVERTVLSDDHAPETVGFPDRRAVQLLGRLCDAAVERLGERIFATVRDQGEAVAVVRQLGFTPVAREQTYLLPSGLPLVRPDWPPAGLRRQERADAVAIHQLYQQQTPPVVQLAEGLRVAAWEAPRRPFGELGGLRVRLTRGRVTRQWVLSDGGHIEGWMRVTIARRGAHHLAVMIAPSRADLAPSLIASAVAFAHDVRSAPIIVRVRDHQWVERDAVEAIGFRSGDANLVMMKQLAIPVPTMRRSFAGALERAVS